MTTDEQRRPDLAAVEELLAAAELRDAEEPHTILVRDLWAGCAYATGIYPSAYAAVDDLEKVLHEATMGACDTGEYETRSPSRSSRCTAPAAAATSSRSGLTAPAVSCKASLCLRRALRLTRGRPGPG
jgi:hypothetical protein